MLQENRMDVLLHVGERESRTDSHTFVEAPDHEGAYTGFLGRFRSNLSGFRKRTTHVLDEGANIETMLCMDTNATITTADVVCFTEKIVLKIY